MHLDADLVDPSHATPSTAHAGGDTARRGGRARRRFAVVAAALIATGALAGCSDDDSSDEAVEVVAVDFAFQDLPERIDVDSVLTLRNDSDVEVHELVAFLLPDDVDGTAEEILALPEDELDAMLGGPPALVIVTPPDGESVVAVGDGTLPGPGRYLLLCGIPTGADPAEFMAAAADSDGPPDIEGGPPHFVHGMAATIDVTRR